MAYRSIPYEVEPIEHGFALNFGKALKYPSTRTGTKAGDPTVTQMKVISYSLSGIVQCNLDFFVNSCSP